MDKENTRKLFEQLYEDRENKSAQMIFNLLFVSLVSSDTCVDKQSCIESLKELENLKIGLDKSNIPKDFKKEYYERLEQGITIVTRDLNLF